MEITGVTDWRNGYIDPGTWPFWSQTNSLAVLERNQSCFQGLYFVSEWTSWSQNGRVYQLYNGSRVSVHSVQLLFHQRQKPKGIYHRFRQCTYWLCPQFLCDATIRCAGMDFFAVMFTDIKERQLTFITGCVPYARTYGRCQVCLEWKHIGFFRVLSQRTNAVLCHFSRERPAHRKLPLKCLLCVSYKYLVLFNC